MEQIVITAVIFVIGIGIGALGRDLVRTGRRENAFTRRFGEDLDAFLVRFRQTTGAPVGVIDPFPERPERWWESLHYAPAADTDPDPVPDDEREVPAGDDEYPAGMRAEFGAMRLPVEEPRGDADMFGWHVNPRYETHRQGPGAHRAVPEPEQTQTRDLRAAVGVAAPPGVSA